MCHEIVLLGIKKNMVSDIKIPVERDGREKNQVRMVNIR